MSCTDDVTTNGQGDAGCDCPACACPGDPLRQQQQHQPSPDVRVIAHLAFPAPDTAYANAPHTVEEISEVLGRTATATGREFWLRKAALLDRIALKETVSYAPDVAAEAVTAAEEAACQLARFDRSHHTTRGPLAPWLTPPGTSYRSYVRQEYRAWSATSAES